MNQQVINVAACISMAFDHARENDFLTAGSYIALAHVDVMRMSTKDNDILVRADTLVMRASRLIRAMQTERNDLYDYYKDNS